MWGRLSTPADGVVCNLLLVGGVLLGMDALTHELRDALVADLDAGFVQVMHSYGWLVYSVALRLSAHPAEAEDLAAESFLRAYRALRGYDQARLEELRVRPGLLTIVRNAARNAARNASRRPAPPPASNEQAPEEPAGGPSVEQQAERHEMQRELGVLLEELSDAQRLAVVLRHVVDLPISEVAEVMGCPEGTAKSHVSRGLSRLRSLMEQDGRIVR